MIINTSIRVSCDMLLATPNIEPGLFVAVHTTGSGGSDDPSMDTLRWMAFDGWLSMIASTMGPIVSHRKLLIGSLRLSAIVVIVLALGWPLS